MKAGVMEEVKRLFKPEFINRIDEIMVFHPLTKENMKQIITLLSRDLTDRCSKQLNIHLTITPAAKNFIVEKHSDLKMGARPLKRAIQNMIEDALAEEILARRIQPGDNVTVGCKEGKITFQVKNRGIPSVTEDKAKGRTIFKEDKRNGSSRRVNPCRGRRQHQFWKPHPCGESEAGGLFPRRRSV